jgi:DNA ligase-1
VTRFADVAAASDAAAGTRSRLTKVAAFTELFATLTVDEVPVVASLLSGGARQGRIGVGWATVGKLRDLPAWDGEAVLEVMEVDAALDALAVAVGPGSQAARKAILDELFGRATEREADLLRRLLIGELRQGALESLVGDAVAKAAGVPVKVVRRAAMLAGDLGTVAAVALHGGGREALEAVGLTVGTPVQPMLAATSATVAEALEETGEASVEWKLDGARIQAHRQGDEVRLWTRNLNEVTDRLPTICSLVRSFPCESVVLDGESIFWLGEEGGVPAAFQDTMSSFGKRSGDAGASLAARFFDVLHVDGEDLLDRPLRERIEVLERVCGAAAMPRLLTADAVAATTFGEDALAMGHEGVMVKDLDSPYEAGRRGGSWRKVKPVKTLDLVVLAVEWGSGRRQGWLSNLWLGARATDRWRQEQQGGPGGHPADDEQRSAGAVGATERRRGGAASPADPERAEAEAGAEAPQGRSGAGADHEFVMVGKTFKGLTDALLTWQTEQLLARETHREGHVVHVRPELVIEIALDGVQRSTRYPGGVALRFARVKQYREDKDPVDADTIETVQALGAAAPST